MPPRKPSEGGFRVAGVITAMLWPLRYRASTSCHRDSTPSGSIFSMPLSGTSMMYASAVFSGCRDSPESCTNRTGPRNPSGTTNRTGRSSERWQPTSRIAKAEKSMARIFCPTSKMSHGLLGRDSCIRTSLFPQLRFCFSFDSTRRDRAGRWLWRLVGPFHCCGSRAAQVSATSSSAPDAQNNSDSGEAANVTISSSFAWSARTISA
jgi:hypothetical protein